jgi:hypothetical protein
MLETAVAAFGADVDEAVGFECADEFPGGNAARDVHTVATTAGDSISAAIASGGISFPSSLKT